MRLLVDTNIPSRLADRSHSDRQATRLAVRALRRRGDEFFLVPQVLYEFWVVCTRPIEQNGFGFGTREAFEKQAKVMALFTLLPDTEAILPVWQRLVVEHDVKGKNAHDARMVAAMEIHDLEGILTFNTVDFARYPGIRVLDPGDFAQAHSEP